MTLVVSLIMLPAALYLLWHFFKSGKVVFDDKWTQTIIPILLVSFYLFPISALLDFFITGSIDILKYPKTIVYWFWFGLIFVFQLLTWVIIADIIKLISRFFIDNKKALIQIHAQAVLVLLLLIFSFTGWKVYKQTTAIVIDEIELSLNELPPVLHGFKIIHISDIQGDEYTGNKDIANYIEQVNEQNSDLIIFTGDLISYGTDFIKMAAQELGKVKATYGTVAVVGDHDFWAGVKNVEKALTKEGIPLLRDENYTINVDNSARILVTGVTEVYSKESNPLVVDSLMQQANGQALKVLATHQVDDHLIAGAIEYDYDMMLAGHTHGGQIRVPFMGMTFSASNLETDFISGVYYIRDLLININNGLGYTLAPIRYNAPASISIITLKEE